MRFGPATSIIQTAMELDILCRPKPETFLAYSGNSLTIGEALKPTPEGFELIIASSNNWNGYFTVKPTMLFCDWEILTKEMLEEEYKKDCHFEWRA